MLKKLKLNSIEGKIMVSFSILVLIACLAFGFTSYIKSSSALNDTTTKLLKNLSKQSAKTIDTKLQEKLSKLECIANIPSITDPKVKPVDKIRILKREAVPLNSLRLGLIDLNGNGMYTNGKSIDAKNYPVLMDAIKGKKCISSPIQSPFDKQLVIDYAIPLKADGKIIGALTCVDSMEELNRIRKHITIDGSDDSFIVDNEGTSISDKNMQFVRDKRNNIELAKTHPEDKSTGKAVKKMVDGTTGVTEYNYNDINKIMAYSKIPSANWSIAVVLIKSDVMKELNSLVKSNIILLIVVVAISIVITKLLAKKISHGIIKTIDYIKIASNGDLTFDIQEKYLNSNDEIGIMSNSLNHMKSSIGTIVYSIKDTSENLNIEAASLYSAANEMSTSSENVSLSIQEVAKGTQDQSEELAEITKILNEFSNSINKAVTSIESIESEAVIVKDTSDESSKEMETLLTSISTVSNAFNNLAEKNKNMEANIGKITEITDLINSIADQTNLLALNAAIEAARVGDAGKGFAVVAEEIRKLAEQCKESSSGIVTLVSTVVEDINVVSSSTDTVKGDLKDHEKVLDVTSSSFNKILSSINEIMPKIKDITKLSTGINKDKDVIVGKIENISAVSEEVSASSEEISASGEELSAISNQVEQTSKKLTNMTEDMGSKVNTFKVNKKDLKEEPLTLENKNIENTAEIEPVQDTEDK